jgi:hypothetical protein
MQHPNEHPTPAELFEHLLALRALARARYIKKNKAAALPLYRTIISQIEKAVKAAKTEQQAAALAKNCSPNKLLTDIIAWRALKADFDAYTLICEFGEHCELVKTDKGEDKLYLPPAKAYFPISPEAAKIIAFYLHQDTTVQIICPNEYLLKVFCGSEITRFFFDTGELPKKHKDGIFLTVQDADQRPDKNAVLCVYNSTSHEFIGDKKLGFRDYLDYFKSK